MKIWEGKIAVGPLNLMEGQKTHKITIIESMCGLVKPVDLGRAEISLLEAKGKKGLFTLEGRFQMSDTKNQNGRMYPKSIWDSQLVSGSSLLMKAGSGEMLGECDHPNDGETKLQRVCCMTTKVWENASNPQEVLGRMVVFDTAKGRDLLAIAEAGGRFGVSSRGQGSLVRIDGVDVVQNDFEVCCWDLVYNPSTPGAYPDRVSESSNRKVFHLKENVDMAANRLQELTERFNRFSQKDLGSLGVEAAGLVCEEVKAIQTSLTEGQFGEETVKAAALVTQVTNFLNESHEKVSDMDEGEMPPQFKKKEKKDDSDESDDDDDDEDDKDKKDKKRPETAAEAVSVLSQRKAASGIQDLSEAVQESRRVYRDIFEVEGPLSRQESEGVLEYAKTVIESTEDSKKAVPEIRARIRVGLTESKKTAEIKATSEEELNTKIQEATLQNKGSTVIVEVDRSEAVYADAARRFEPLVESEVKKALVATREAGVARASLTEKSAKLAALVQVAGVLKERVLSAESKSVNNGADLSAAVELIEALVEELDTVRLKGVVEGISSTHIGIPSLVEDLSSARTPGEAIKITNRKVLESLPTFSRDGIGDRKVSEALKVSKDKEASVIVEQRAAISIMDHRMQTLEESTGVAVEALRRADPTAK